MNVDEAEVLFEDFHKGWGQHERSNVLVAANEIFEPEVSLCLIHKVKLLLLANLLMFTIHYVAFVKTLFENPIEEESLFDGEVGSDAKQIPETLQINYSNLKHIWFSFLV